MINFVKHIVRIVGSGLILILILELFLRVAGVQQPLWTEIDPVYGKLFKADVPMTFYNEGFSLTDSDKSGFTSFRSSSESTNIFTFYGDSYPEAHQVFKRHHFLKGIQENFENVYAINLSMSGFDFSDSYTRYLLFDSTLKSDHAFFFLSDDDFEQDDDDPYIPTIKLKDGELNLQNNFAVNAGATTHKYILPLLRKSSLAYLFRRAVQQYKSRDLISILTGGRWHDIKIIKERPVSIDPVFYSIFKQWDRKHCTVIYRGKKPIPKEYQKLLQAYQIPFFDLEKALRLKCQGGNIEDLYYHKGTRQFGHWNIDGHRLIAEILSERFEHHWNK